MAFELMVVLMRKVENSANELNIGNVVREVYLIPHTITRRCSRATCNVMTLRQEWMS